MSLLAKVSFQQLFIISVLILITSLSYFNIFPNQFNSDEKDFIVYWHETKSWDGVVDLIKGATPPAHTGVFRPVRGVIYLFMYQFFAEKIFAYHLLSLLTHISVTITSYFLIKKLTKDKHISIFTALFFATHPIHVDAVTFMTNTFDNIGILFLLTSYCFYIKSKSANFRINISFWVSLAFANLAFYTYEVALIYPLILVIHELFINKLKPIRVLKLRYTYAIAASLLLYLIIRVFILKIYTRGSYLEESILLTYIVSLKSIFVYFKTLLLPMYLSINHVIPRGIHTYQLPEFNKDAILAQAITQPETLISLLFLIILIGIVITQRQKRPMISYSLLWFLISLLPVINLLPNRSIFFERYAYLASVGFCLLQASMIIEIKKRLKLSMFTVYAIVILITAVYSYRTIQRNYDWRSEETLYIQAINSNPNAYLYFKLGSYYGQQNLLSQADAAYNQAIDKEPQFYEAMYNLAIIKELTGEYHKAIELYRQCLSINPQFTNAYINLSNVYLASQQYEEAVKVLHNGFLTTSDWQIQQSLFRVYSLWAQAYINNQDWQNAAARLEEAIKYAPDNADTWHNLGSTYAQQQQWPQAAHAYQQALRIDPNREVTKQQLYQVRQNYNTYE